MSLVLVGKTLDDKLVLACDGRAIKAKGESARITDDNTRKIFHLGNESVAVSVGTYGFMEDLSEIAGNLLSKGTSAEQLHNMISDKSSPFGREAFEMVERFVRDDSFFKDNLTYFFYFTLDGKVSALRIKGEQPYIKPAKTFPLDSIDPVFSSGFPEQTREVHNAMVYLLPEIFYSEFAKPYLTFLADHASQHDKVIGGEVSSAELTRNGFRWDTQSDIDKNFARAEQIRMMYEAVKSNSPNKDESLGEMISQYFDNQDLLFRIAGDYINSGKLGNIRLTPINATHCGEVVNIGYSILEDLSRNVTNEESLKLLAASFHKKGRMALGQEKEDLLKQAISAYETLLGTEHFKIAGSSYIQPHVIQMGVAIIDLGLTQHGEERNKLCFQGYETIQNIVMRFPCGNAMAQLDQQKYRLVNEGVFSKEVL